jgi:hypothetical protein
MGAFWSLTPVYGERVGLDEAGIGLLMTAAIVGGALLQWPMGRFSDAGDRRLALSVAAFGAALAAVAVALFGHLEHVPLAGLFLYGGMAFTVYPIVVAHLVDHLPQDQILAGNTTVLFLHGVGAAVGPGIAGALMGWVGAIALPLHLGLAFVPLGLFALVLSRRSEDEIVEGAAQFTPMMRTSHTVLEMVSPEGAEAVAEAAEGAEAAEAADVPGLDAAAPAIDVGEDREEPTVEAPRADAAAALVTEAAGREDEDDTDPRSGAESVAVAEAAEAALQPPHAPDPGALLRPPPSSAPTTDTAESRAAG